MWLIFKFLEERKDKKKAKKTKGQFSEEDTFETSLNAVNEKNRQEVLKDLEKDQVLKIDTFLTDERLNFEVFTGDKKSIGTIPVDVSEKLELAMEEGLEPYIVNYALREEGDGLCNCNLTLGLKKDEI